MGHSSDVVSHFHKVVGCERDKYRRSGPSYVILCFMTIRIIQTSMSSTMTSMCLENPMIWSVLSERNLQLFISEKACCGSFASGELQGRCTCRSTWRRPSICKDFVTVLPLACSLGRHGTVLMNNAWGHLPPLNYRSVEARHMGTAQQVLMANSP